MLLSYIDCWDVYFHEQIFYIFIMAKLTVEMLYMLYFDIHYAGLWAKHSQVYSVWTYKL